MRLPPLSVSAADRLLAELVPSFREEQVPLAKAAGRVLARPLLADRDAPPFHRVAMDGIAVAGAAWEAGQRRFRLAGTAAAGEAPLRLADPAQALEVMTGAVLPEGCDRVVPVEDLVREGDQQVSVRADLACPPGRHVHARADDARAGDQLLAAGLRLDSPALAVAASVGASCLWVRRAPRVALLATGSELVDVADTPQAWQIRASNLAACAAALERAGHAPLLARRVQDDPDRLARSIHEALEAAELLVLSGGVSMGRYDLVPGLLEQAGGVARIHGVLQRPGKPLLVVDFPARPGRLAVGLPGNPVSALTCLHRHVLPWLAAAEGRVEPLFRVPLLESVKRPRGLSLFLPVRLEPDPHGRAAARPAPTGGSGDLVRLAGSHGFVELEPDAEGRPAPAGTLAHFRAWS
jgi:molybdopterin molybdotransferase